VKEEKNGMGRGGLSWVGRGYLLRGKKTSNGGEKGISRGKEAGGGSRAGELFRAFQIKTGEKKKKNGTSRGRAGRGNSS